MNRGILLLTLWHFVVVAQAEDNLGKTPLQTVAREPIALKKGPLRRTPSRRSTRNNHHAVNHARR